MRKNRDLKKIVALLMLAVMVAGLTLPLIGTGSKEPVSEQQGTVQTDGQDNESSSGEQGGSGEGRVFFIGDSRTIDMFADSDNELMGEEHDGVLVYARHGFGYGYLEELSETLALTENDTIVSWMGANDRGIFPAYGTLYERLLSQGVRLVVCTVGPTGSRQMENWDNFDYDNELMQQFNTGLISWAAAHNVPVIDLYSYVSRNVEIDMADGVHYLPRPDPVLWGYILEKLTSYGVVG